MVFRMPMDKASMQNQPIPLEKRMTPTRRPEAKLRSFFQWLVSSYSRHTGNIIFFNHITLLPSRKLFLPPATWLQHAR